MSSATGSPPSWSRSGAAISTRTNFTTRCDMTLPMTKTLALILISLAACGDDGGSTKTPDAAPVNTMVTVSGIATEISATGRVPQEGVKIDVVKEGETTPTATTTSGADGAYTVTFATGGTAVNGYLHATKGTTYL